MIPRYSRPEMAAIWSPETKFRIWFEIEAHALDAMAELGLVPKEAAAKVWEKGKGRRLRRRAHRRDRARGEARRHRLPDASCRDRRAGGAVRASRSDLLRRARHLLQRAAHARGRPSDRRRRSAARGTQAARLRVQGHADHRPFARHSCGADHIRPEARFRLCGVRPRTRARLRGRARKSRPRPSPVRSAPSPMSIRASKRMSRARIGPDSPSRSRRRSSRATATRCSSPRLAVVASSVERLATEIRHLQRTEVLEAEEYFSPGQKGSSAMPHKRNPVLSENLVGLARMVRAYALPAMERRGALARARHLAFFG